jgi:hypothetical protein
MFLSIKLIILFINCTFFIKGSEIYTLDPKGLSEFAQKTNQTETLRSNYGTVYLSFLDYQYQNTKDLESLKNISLLLQYGDYEKDHKPVFNHQGYRKAESKEVDLITGLYLKSRLYVEEEKFQSSKPKNTLFNCKALENQFDLLKKANPFILQNVICRENFVNNYTYYTNNRGTKNLSVPHLFTINFFEKLYDECFLGQPGNKKFSFLKNDQIKYLIKKLKEFDCERLKDDGPFVFAEDFENFMKDMLRIVKSEFQKAVDQGYTDDHYALFKEIIKLEEEECSKIICNNSRLSEWLDKYKKKQESNPLEYCLSLTYTERRTEDKKRFVIRMQFFYGVFSNLFGFIKNELNADIADTLDILRKFFIEENQSIHVLAALLKMMSKENIKSIIGVEDNNGDTIIRFSDGNAVSLTEVYKQEECSSSSDIRYFGYTGGQIPLYDRVVNLPVLEKCEGTLILQMITAPHTASFFLDAENFDLQNKKHITILQNYINQCSQLKEIHFNHKHKTQEEAIRKSFAINSKTSIYFDIN